MLTRNARRYDFITIPSDYELVDAVSIKCRVGNKIARALIIPRELFFNKEKHAMITIWKHITCMLTQLDVELDHQASVIQKIYSTALGMQGDNSISGRKILPIKLEIISPNSITVAEDRLNKVKVEAAAYFLKSTIRSSS